MSFVGRKRELTELNWLLEVVRRGERVDRGVAVMIRGRRRVGKSRLANEFVQRAGLPHAYFQAARWAPPRQELALFADAIATSTLPEAAIAAGNTPTTLTAALTLLASALPTDTPSVVVLDEVPWLLENIDGGAGEFQRVWDSRLSNKPVLVLLLGSDLGMMEQLTRPDQPFFGRATEMVLESLTPRDVASMTELKPFQAFDAYLITGGLPLVVQEWERGMTMRDFLASSFDRSTSALVVSGTRILDNEFGEASLARQVLTALGGRGERTFTRIQLAARGQPLNATSLNNTLAILHEKRVVAADEPLSTKRSHKDRRWRIADPALRFWLAFLEPALAEIDRGRPDLALRRVEIGYEAWRGRAIEPVVRDGLSRFLPDEKWPAARLVGGWWPRTNQPEIDLVGADHSPAKTLAFVGTIKWRNSGRMRAAEIQDLAAKALHVPGFRVDVPLVGVCPAGAVSNPLLSAVWGASGLLKAWP